MNIFYFTLEASAASSAIMASACRILLLASGPAMVRRFFNLGHDLLPRGVRIVVFRRRENHRADFAEFLLPREYRRNKARTEGYT
jgi:hypothetical protein